MWSWDRGQAEVLGFVLLIGLTLAGMTAVVVIGSSALTESQANSQVDRAEHAMTQLDSKMSLVALGGSTAQQSVMSRESSGTRLFVDESAGWMNVSIYNSTDDTLDVAVMNVTMGAVIYENEQKHTAIAYQGGGVWRSDPSGSSMISPPEFHYRTGQGEDPTLTLPLVVIVGDQSLGNTVSLNKNGQTQAKYPMVNDDVLSNPLREGTVNVTIQSEYYQAWGRFFESRTGGTVTYDHSNNIVMISLVSTGQQHTITNGLTASGAGEELSLEGAGSDPTHLDSYNSSQGDYATTVTSNGTFESAGFVDITSNIELEGSVRSGDTVDVGGNAYINGTVFWTSEPPHTFGNPTITGGTQEIDGVDPPDPIGSKVRSKIDDIVADNDNSGSDVDDNSFDDGDSLSPGDYYIDSSDASGTITFQVTDEDDLITIGVDGDLNLDNADFDVQGDGIVRIYVTGNIDIKNSQTSISADRSSQLWIYGTEDAGVEIEDSIFTGVIYAPTGSTGDGSVNVEKSEVYGAVVGGATTFKHSAIHQDLALNHEIPLPNDPNIPRITFLHISVNEVTISDA